MESSASKVCASSAVDAMVKSIAAGAKKGPVQLVGFGTFKVSKRKARTGLNPRTGEKIKIPAKKVLTFKASKNLKY